MFLGTEDLHDEQFDKEEIRIEFSDYQDPNMVRETDDRCVYYYSLYPSAKFVERYQSSDPTIFTAIIASTFLLMATSFFIYDRYVKKRNDKVVGAAAKNSAIVSSLFPSNVRDGLDQMYSHKIHSEKQPGAASVKHFLTAGDDRAKRYDNESSDFILAGKPLADLFPETTISE